MRLSDTYGDHSAACKIFEVTGFPFLDLVIQARC